MEWKLHCSGVLYFDFPLLRTAFLLFILFFLNYLLNRDVAWKVTLIPWVSAHINLTFKQCKSCESHYFRRVELIILKWIRLNERVSYRWLFMIAFLLFVSVPCFINETQVYWILFSVKLKEQFTQNEISVMYSLPCCSKPLWLPFFLPKKAFWIMQLVAFFHAIKLNGN